MTGPPLQLRGLYRVASQDVYRSSNRAYYLTPLSFEAVQRWPANSTRKRAVPVFAVRRDAAMPVRLPNQAPHHNRIDC